MFSPVYQSYSDHTLASFGTSWLVETCIEVTKRMVLRNVGGSSRESWGPGCKCWFGTASGSELEHLLLDLRLFVQQGLDSETWEYPFVRYLGLWLACRERKMRGWAKMDFSWQPSIYFNWRGFQHRCDPKGKTVKARPSTSGSSRTQDAKCHRRMFKWRKEERGRKIYR